MKKPIIERLMVIDFYWKHSAISFKSPRKNPWPILGGICATQDPQAAPLGRM